MTDGPTVSTSDLDAQQSRDRDLAALDPLEGS